MKSWNLARGYRYSGVHCGIRSDKGRLDLALVVSDIPASGAGVFTQNRVCAAPVKVCKERLPNANIRGIIICSGNANACTGQQGLDDARRMAALTSQQIECQPEQILVCSTGVIGRTLPMPALTTGVPKAFEILSAGSDALTKAATAIMTTDTQIKVRTASVNIDGQEIRLTGFAKGAAMIGPNMATMLAFVLTDAAIDARDLAAMAPVAAERSFNSISVEGHTSTNDSLIFLANGQGKKLRGAALDEFNIAATRICADLARDIAADAEGASHLITIDVEGLPSEGEARQVAKAVANSPLVKTAIFGGDPNWGRIVSAAGYAGVEFAEEELSLWLGDFKLYERGRPLPFDASGVSAFIKNNRELTMKLVFERGNAGCRFYTCDLTYEYVRLNADYTT